MRFEVLARAGAARRARLTLAHGVVETPVFMPVGTYGAVKAMSPAELTTSARRSSSATHSICGCARPTSSAHGGLHGFTGWSGRSRRIRRLPGLQPGAVRKVREDGRVRVAGQRFGCC
jgi:queuine tRNA-ribosyltransferase